MPNIKDSFLLNLLYKIALCFCVLYYSNVLIQIAKEQFKAFSVSIFILVVLFSVMVYLFFKTKPNLSIWRLFIFSFFIRFLLAVFLDIQQTSDFEKYYIDIQDFIQSPSLELLYNTKSPFTILYFSIFGFLFGTSLMTMYIASSFAWALQSVLVFYSLINFQLSKLSRNFCTIIFTLVPGIIIYSGVVSSEAVFCLLNLAIVFSFSQWLRTSSKMSLILISIASGFLLLTRTTGVFYVFPIFLLIAFKLLIDDKVIFKKLSTLSFLCFPVILILFFQISLNYSYGQRISFSCSEWGSICLMVGTSPKSKGSYFNKADLKDIGYSKTPTKEVNAKARNLAFSRVTGDPLGFLKLSLLTKIRIYYGSESSFARFALKKSKYFEEFKNNGTYLSIKKIINGYYLFIMFGFYGFLLLALFNSCQNENLHIKLLIILPIFLKALFHLFFNVQERYHMPLIIYFLMFIGLVINDLYKDKNIYHEK